MNSLQKSLIILLVTFLASTSPLVNTGSASDNTDRVRSESLAETGERSFRKKEYREAKKIFEKSLQLRSSNAMATYYLAKIYVGSRDTDAAQRLVDSYFNIAANRDITMTALDKKFLPKLERLSNKLGRPMAQKTVKKNISTTRSSGQKAEVIPERPPENMDEFIK